MRPPPAPGDRFFVLTTLLALALIYGAVISWVIS